MMKEGKFLHHLRNVWYVSCDQPLPRRKSYIQQLLNSHGLWLFLFCEFFPQLVNMCFVFLLHQQIWCGQISREAVPFDCLWFCRTFIAIICLKCTLLSLS